ncbi:MAG: DHH family phosphoesterase, partial [Nanoarchaeota archaeon]
MEINLIIKSEKLEKIKQELLNTANEIKDAINNKQPIWIRHHNDCDGYSGAVILEKAILTHLHKFHKRESDIFYYFKRFPLRTPYYDYFDVTKDISTFLADYERFQRKKPLIIIIDTGSNTESLLALKKLAVYNIDVIVIDHHPINDENIKYIKKHINSTTINDGSITAGMLSCEISKLLEPNIKNPELFAALSGIGDKSENFEQEEYFKKTLNLGFTKEYLSELKDMINFESDYLLFNESKSYIHDILFNSIDNQKKIIEITKEENNKINEKLLFTIKKYIEEINCNISENKNNSEIFNN